MEYNLATKKNELLIHRTTLMNLKIIILSEISQTKKSTYYVIHLCKILENTTL